MAKKKQNSDICSEDVEILDDVWDQEEKIFRDPTARTVMTFNFQEPDDEALLTNETEKNTTNQFKEKSISEIKETPFAGQRGESSNAPANNAGDQMLSGAETTAREGASLTYRGGKKLAQATTRKIKEKQEFSRTLSEAKHTTGKTMDAAQSAASKIRTKHAAFRAVKGKLEATLDQKVNNIQNGNVTITVPANGKIRSLDASSASKIIGETTLKAVSYTHLTLPTT